MKRENPRRVGEALAAFTGRVAPEGDLAHLQSIWREAVGEWLADNCEPVAEREGVVQVVCSSSVWAQEVQLISEDIVAKLNGYLGDGKVSALEARTGLGK